MVWPLIMAHILGSMEEEEECDYDHTRIDDSSARGGDKENRSVGEDNSNMCKDVVTQTKLMQSQFGNDIHEDVSFDMPWMF